MKKTDLKGKTFSDIGESEIARFEQWSSDFISTELENFTYSGPNLQAGLEDIYTSMDSIFHLIEEIYSFGLDINTKKVPRSKNVNRNQYFGDDTFIDTHQESSWSTLRSPDPPIEFSEFSRDEYSDEPSFHEATSVNQPQLIHENDSQIEDSFLNPLTYTEEVKRKSKMDLRSGEGHQVLEKKGVDDGSSFSQNSNVISEAEDFSRNLPSSFDQANEKNRSDSIQIVGGLGDFLNHISSQDYEKDELHEVPGHSAPAGNFNYNDNVAPINNSLEPDRRSIKQKIFVNEEQISAFSEASLNTSNSHFKTEELFDEFSKIIQRSYHKYYGKH